MVYVLHTQQGNEIAFYLESCAELFVAVWGGWIEPVDRELLTEQITS